MQHQHQQQGSSSPPLLISPTNEQHQIQLKQRFESGKPNSNNETSNMETSKELDENKRSIHSSGSSSSSISSSNSSCSNGNNDDTAMMGDEVRYLFEKPGQCNVVSKTLSARRRLEDDVADSPEIFPKSSNYHVESRTTGTTMTVAFPTTNNEQATERYDLLNKKQQEALWANVKRIYDPISSSPTASITAMTTNIINIDSRPPKKHFMQMSDVPYIRPFHQPSAFVEPWKHIQPSSGEQFQQVMNQWEWVHVDGLKMPVIIRGNDRFAAVHIVQLKLLSKFPSNIPPEMVTKFMMISHKMLPAEAWIFNIINAVICKFDLGCHLFTQNDEIVRLTDMQRFYWSVKAWNLSRMIETYNIELRNATSTHLIAVITQLKHRVQADLQEVEKELLQTQTNATANTAVNFVPPHQLMHILAPGEERIFSNKKDRTDILS